MPAGISFTVKVNAASVAFPIFPATESSSPNPGRPLRIELDQDWSEWLVYQFARSIGYLRGATSDASLLDLVAGSHHAPQVAETQSVPLPPMPSSPEASAIAHSLLQRPGDPSETAEHARSVALGIRTLQQQFTEETGLPFARWRTAVRVAAAATLLDSGHEVGEAARQVGFSTPAGFTKAFRARTGMTPRQYKTKRAPHPHHDQSTFMSFGKQILPQRQPQMEQVEASPPPIPAAQTWNRINDFHVLVWVYRGSARVTVGDHTRRLTRGDAIWLPAGVRNSITLPRGSLILPLGSRHSSPAIELPSKLVQRFPDAAEPYLLHALISNYTLLRPEEHDPNRITRLFLQRASLARSETAHALSGTTAVQKIINTVRHNPADRRTLSLWAEELDSSTPALGRDFLAATGQTYTVWRSEVRMTVARQYLEEGMGVAQVSRKLGYAHRSAFAAVFTRSHGMSPRDYQQRGWQHTKEPLIVR